MRLNYFRIMKNYTQRFSTTNDSMSYNKFIILDTETTGLDNEDRIIQLAIVVVNSKTLSIEETHCSLCKAPLPIKPKAAAINKKTDEMLEDKPIITHTDAYRALEKYNKPENVIVVHNAFFDLYMLAKEMFLIKAQLVDTLTCGRYVYPKIENYKLQSLLQHNEAYKKVIQEHDALSDCLMCLSLLRQMLDYSSFGIDKMIEWTKEPVIGFGKHRGTKLTELGKKHPDYIEWVMKNYDKLDVPTRLVMKCLVTPNELDNTELKGLRYLRMDHLV